MGCTPTQRGCPTPLLDLSSSVVSHPGIETAWNEGPMFQHDYLPNTLPAVPISMRPCSLPQGEAGTRIPHRHPFPLITIHCRRLVTIPQPCSEPTCLRARKALLALFALTELGGPQGQKRLLNGLFRYSDPNKRPELRNSGQAVYR